VHESKVCEECDMNVCVRVCMELIVNTHEGKRIIP
jgi:hypothetical protein